MPKQDVVTGVSTETDLYPIGTCIRILQCYNKCGLATQQIDTRRRAREDYDRLRSRGSLQAAASLSLDPLLIKLATVQPLHEGCSQRCRCKELTESKDTSSCTSEAEWEAMRKVGSLKLREREDWHPRVESEEGGRLRLARESTTAYHGGDDDRSFLGRVFADF